MNINRQKNSYSPKSNQIKRLCSTQIFNICESKSNKTLNKKHEKKLS